MKIDQLAFTTDNDSHQGEKRNGGQLQKGTETVGQALDQSGEDEG